MAAASPPIPLSSSAMTILSYNFLLYVYLPVLVMALVFMSGGFVLLDGGSGGFALFSGSVLDRNGGASL